MSAAGEFAVVFRLCEVDVVVDRPPATRFALVGRHTYLGEWGEDEVLREVIETFAAPRVRSGRQAEDGMGLGLGCFVSYVSYIMYKAATEKISSLRESTSPSFSLLRPQQVLRDQDQPRELIA